MSAVTQALQRGCSVLTILFQPLFLHFYRLQAKPVGGVHRTLRFYRTSWKPLPWALCGV